MSEILITLSTFGEHSAEPIRILNESGRTYSLNQSGQRMLPEEVIVDGSESVGIIAGVEMYSEETLIQLPKLRVISRVGVGIDNIDAVAAQKLGIQIVNTPDEPADAVAELAIMMMLGLLRRLPRIDKGMRAGKWERTTGNLLKGKKVGIVGLGRIGKRVVDCLSGFGVELFAYDPLLDLSWCNDHQVRAVNLDELLTISDIVTLHASGGVKLSAMEFSLMKKGSVLLNLARGEMVDEESLVDSLRRGHLAGAGLDVFPEEPYTGRLIEIENVILTPHQSTLTLETRSSMEENAVRNLLRAIS